MDGGEVERGHGWVARSARVVKHVRAPLAAAPQLPSSTHLPASPPYPETQTPHTPHTPHAPHTCTCPAAPCPARAQVCVLLGSRFSPVVSAVVVCAFTLYVTWTLWLTNVGDG